MHRVITVAAVAALVGGPLAIPAAWGQPAQLLFQENERDAPRALSEAERAKLGDPLFALVLRDHPEAMTLSEIQALLQPNENRRRVKVFVVDERLADPGPNAGDGHPASRRSVLSYEGVTNGVPLTGNVMLSLFFDSQGFPDAPGAIEAWGWDEARGVYNYYKLNQGRAEDRASWKFRGSSEGADLLTTGERAHTCLACHINGAPIMKELLFPWNNWHSPANPARYLESGSPSAWPAAAREPLRSNLASAERLEPLIIDSIRRFNGRRIDAMLRPHDAEGGGPALDDEGRAEITSAKRLLRPLFETTEFNIISSEGISGMHPLPVPAGQGPGSPIPIPNSFFLNANLIAGEAVITRLDGLGIRSAREFEQAAKVSPDEYARLVRETGLRVAGQPGDTVFAWFVPEPSQVDNDMVEQLMERGIVTPQFVAAVLAVDLETPLLSADRAALLSFVPDDFRFRPLDGQDPLAANRHPDELTEAVIAAIRASNPAAGSAEAEFLTLLQMDDPLAELRSRVEAYRDRVVNRLNDPATRGEELERLFDLALQRRRAILDHKDFGVLVEAKDALFAVPPM